MYFPPDYLQRLPPEQNLHTEELLLGEIQGKSKPKRLLKNFNIFQ
jgi:hypothetical protein